MLLVVSAASKTSFAQLQPCSTNVTPDGVLGEITYRMQAPLGEGRFAEAVDSGVHVFANAVAEKIGFKVSELESPVAANTSEVTTDSPQSALVSAKDAKNSSSRRE